MSKVLQRLLVFFIGLPLVIAVVLLNQFHHIALHALLLCASALGAGEMHSLFAKKFAEQPRALVTAMALVPPLVGTVCAVCGFHPAFIDYAFLAAVMVCMAYEAVLMREFSGSVARLVTSTFIILYCGFLPTFISRMTMQNHSREFIIVFLLMVFMCDSLAWLFGNLFGRNNKGFIKSSPNKSIAGFLGGMLGSVLVGVLAHALMPHVFRGPAVKTAVLGLAIALCSIVGDLVESVLKRSTETKDSGTIVPGRGGLLDSIDSIVFAAPVFYIGMNVLYLPGIVR